jgi:hypothetical protein
MDYDAYNAFGIRFGRNLPEQVSNMKFTDAENNYLDKLWTEEPRSMKYYEEAFRLAQSNGLNNITKEFDDAHFPKRVVKVLINQYSAHGYAYVKIVISRYTNSYELREHCDCRAIYAPEDEILYNKVFEHMKKEDLEECINILKKYDYEKYFCGGGCWLYDGMKDRFEASGIVFSSRF